MHFYFFYICRVKLAAYILSVYLMGLTFVPCDDSYVEVNKTEIGSTSVITSPLDELGIDHSHTPASDSCPPFCTCHCCHVHTVDFGGISFQPVNAQVSQTSPAYLDNIQDEVVRSFLDPPRV